MPKISRPADGISSLAPSVATGISCDHKNTYVLMTAAYNEEATIEKTLQSIVSQTIPPCRWAIVSDGSTDRTDEIIQEYARKYAFIRYFRVRRLPGRSFRSKVIALQSASKLLEDVPFEFIGNLDADISVEPSYFSELIARFGMRPTLGLAGGFVHDRVGDDYRNRAGNRVYSVAHAAQLVRRKCYEAIGGYAVLEYGGEDWHAQISAKMNGWQAEAFPELNIFHHRRTGEGDNLLLYKFRQGRMDYSFGSDPFFETLKCLQRLTEKPFLAGGIARLGGFWWSLLRREKRPVSNEFVEFLRQEQKQKILTMFWGQRGPSNRAHDER